MAFPTTALLDDFNRANNPSSLGASWSSPIESGFSSLGILSNQCYPNVGFQDNYWNTNFLADQEAWVTVSVLPVNPTAARVFARLSSVGGSAYNGYGIEVSNTGVAFLSRWVAGAQDNISGGTTTTMAAGDSMGIACVGTSISHYTKAGAGAWTLVVTVTDSSVAGGGFLGLQVRDDTTARLDNFGGGNMLVPTTADNPPIGFSGRGAGW